MTSKERRSATLERSIKAASLTEADDMPTFSTDDYVHVQVGGGRRELSPPVIVTPMCLCQRIKATSRDTGLVRDASFRQSQLLPPVTPPHTSTDMQMDDDPFLSEPIMQLLEVPSNGGAQQSTAVQPPSRNTNVSICGQGMW